MAWSTNLLLAGVLVAAAALKLVLAYERFPVFSVWAYLVVCTVELAIAFGLLVTPQHPVVRISSHSLACCFLGYSVYRLQTGHDCECFGSLTISPEDHFVLSLALVLGCWVSRSFTPVRQSLRHNWIGRPAALVASTLVLLCVGYATASLPGSPIGVNGALVATEGEEWPMAGRIPRLQDDLWEVLVIRLECPKCHAALRGFVSREEEDNNNSRKWGLIILGDSVDLEQSMFDLVVHLPLADRWPIETPCSFELQDGVVQRILKCGR